MYPLASTQHMTCSNSNLIQLYRPLDQGEYSRINAHQFYLALL